MNAAAMDSNALVDLAIQSARSVFDEGGWVLGAIAICSVVAWGLLFNRWTQLRARSKAYELEGDALYGDMQTSRTAMEMWVNGEVGRLRDGLGVARALATLLPLLGLLGTVLGMLETFEVIKVEGTGDPRLMADGIRQALLTTQAGILAALPVLLGLRFLHSRVDRMAGLLELNSHKSILRKDVIRNGATGVEAGG